MASYLATATIGKFELRRARTPGGIPNFAAVDPSTRSLDNLFKCPARSPTTGASVFGPYPFSSTGGMIDDFSAGYALENQTKPLYGGFDPDEKSSRTSWPTSGSATA